MGYASSGNNVDVFFEQFCILQIKSGKKTDSSSSSSPPLKRETNSNQIVIEGLSIE